MAEERYIHSSEKDEVELDRLRIQEGIYDPNTTRRLEIIGVAKGWKCLEVGAGTGSVAQWLSQRVGPTGKVIATDIDLRFLTHVSGPNLEVRRHDITKDSLETGYYDLAHCRLLLSHLPEPEKALRTMADTLRPGGWLVIEDHDHGSVFSIDVTDPSATPFATAIRALFGLAWKTGMRPDPYFGRRLRGLMEGLGFSDVGQNGWTRMYRGGEPVMRFWSVSLQAGAKVLIANGLATQVQLDSALSRFTDPTFNMVGSTMFAAWRRKPVQGGGT